MFKKILIANRGEIALRIIHACRELGVKTVAVYSEADENSLHVHFADEAYCVGPPRSTDSYLNVPNIIAAAEVPGADAIHPGYGFLSESAYLAEVCEACHIRFIGPDPAVIKLLGDKSRARKAMKKAGLPMLPGSDGPVEGDEKALKVANEIGFPVIVKAVAGGGGRGMRVAYTVAELVHSYPLAQAEAESAFGSGDLYLEKYLESSRHIEFQILGDAHGNLVHAFERDCSIQRRYQKVSEESPSPGLSPEVRDSMGRAALDVARAVDYENAGTVEFILDARTGEFYFLEMNTRLQVEHPVTELVTGLDLVKAQIRIAAGEPLPFKQSDLIQSGHALECRVYAEDPARGFLPDAGKVLMAVEPRAPGLRVDSGVGTGDEVSVHYDPMLAKVIVRGESRAEALEKMGWALRHYAVLGPATNLQFLQTLIHHPAFVRGEATAQLVDRELSSWRPTDEPPPDEALVLAALADGLGPSPAAGFPADSRSTAHNPWDALDSFRVGGG